MRIYLTSSWSNRDRARWLSVWLAKQGHTIVSTWHDRDYPEDVPLQWWAAVDLDEIDAADALLVYTDHVDESCKGAMDFEAGYAFARGRRLYWLGKDARNIFLARYADLWPTKPDAELEKAAA